MADSGRGLIWGAVIVLSICGGTGCATPPTGPRRGSPITERLLFATDRPATGSGASKTFGDRDRRQDEDDAQLSYGAVSVDVPADHVIGELEDPQWLGEQSASGPGPAGHIRAHDLRVEPDGSFAAQLAAALRAAPQKQVIIFTHGFNTSFTESVLRVGQLTADLGFEGVAILYSWPAGNAVTGYFADEDSAYWTVDHLAAFLAEVVGETRRVPDAKVHLVAHSLGCRALTLALTELACDLPRDVTLPLFDQVILAAPDMDADKLRLQDLRKIRPLVHRLTLYGSSEDFAIRASKTVHRDVRAGEAGGDRLLVVRNTGRDIDTLDASLAQPASFFNPLAQLYCFEARCVILDVRGVLADAQPMDPARAPRLEQLVDKHKQIYWHFRACGH